MQGRGDPAPALLQSIYNLSLEFRRSYTREITGLIPCSLHILLGNAFADGLVTDTQPDLTLET
jgi:hypothetical protein